MTFWLFFSIVTAGLLFLGMKVASTSSSESGEDAMSDTLAALMCFGAAAVFVIVALLIHLL